MAQFMLCLMGDVCTIRKTKVIMSPTGKHWLFVSGSYELPFSSATCCAEQEYSLTNFVTVSA